jgi:hypothetical protein
MELASRTDPLANLTAADTALLNQGHSRRQLSNLQLSDCEITECHPLNVGLKPELIIQHISPEGQVSDSRIGAKWYMCLVQYFQVAGRYYRSEHEFGVWLSANMASVQEHSVKIFRNLHGEDTETPIFSNPTLHNEAVKVVNVSGE